MNYRQKFRIDHGGRIMKVRGDRIKKLRKERGLTQDGLAIEVNKKVDKKLTKTTISNYETGYSSPSDEILSAISDIFGASADYLLGRSDFPELTVSQDLELTKEAQEILDAINELDPETRKKAWEQLEMFLQYEKVKKS